MKKTFTQKYVISAGVAAFSLGMANPVQAALVYGGGSETASRFNPGAGAIAYMNNFTAVTQGQNVLEVTSAVYGIRRFATAGALLDVGVNLYAAEMTYDGTNFGRGANHLIYSTNSLGAGTATVTKLVNTGSISGVNLALELTSNSGLGGWWMGVEFTGPNAANTANGWRVVNAPTTGSSNNSFGMFNSAGSGVFEPSFIFANSPGGSNRFMVDVNGTLKSVSANPLPVPGPLPLFGLAAAAAWTRRLRSRLRTADGATRKCLARR